MGKQKIEEPMPPDVYRECFRLRCKSKRGGELTRDEMARIQQWQRKYREQYRAMDKDVFRETAPFGAQL